MEDRSLANCSLCEGEFFVRKMTDGKCDLCHARFPHAKTKAEVKALQQSQNTIFNEGSFENRVKKQVYEILEECGILHTCNCGNKYFKRSPNQKSCGCGETE